MLNMKVLTLQNLYTRAALRGCTRLHFFLFQSEKRNRFLVCYCCCSYEVVWIEFIVPQRLIVGLIHAECLMIDTLIIPFSILVKDEHFFGVAVGVDHVEVQALVLLEEWTPSRRTPIVVLRNGNHLVHRHVHSLHSAELKSIELQKTLLRIELHPQDKALVSHARLNQERNETVHFGLMIGGTQVACKATRLADLCQLLVLGRVVDWHGCLRRSHTSGRSGHSVVVALLVA